MLKFHCISQIYKYILIVVVINYEHTANNSFECFKLSIKCVICCCFINKREFNFRRWSTITDNNSKHYLLFVIILHCFHIPLKESWPVDVMVKWIFFGRSSLFCYREYIFSRGPRLK